MRRRPALLALVLSFSVLSVLHASHPDGITLSTNPGPAAGEVILEWTGGQPSFTVYRSIDKTTVLDPLNVIGELPERSLVDAPPAGLVFFYEVTSPCVFNPPEICDGLDNDCNGTVDDRTPVCECLDGEMRTCGTDVGVCSFGTETCVNGAWGTCQGAVGPTAETCDGLDDDCNGVVDDPGSEASCALPNAIAVCTSGTCAVGSCDPGFDDCNVSAADGCETDVASDPDSCGACGDVCSSSNISTRTCTGGVCSGSCDIGFGDCNGDKRIDGCELDVTLDPDSCGACGNVCSSSNISIRTCTGGLCNGTCDTGFDDCDGDKLVNGCETDVTADPLNCGACGSACSSSNIPTPTCTGGVCSGTCDTGFGDCNGDKRIDGCETDVMADPLNCGACGIVCDDADACTSDSCDPATSMCINISLGACLAPACDSPGCGFTDTDGDGLNDEWEVNGGIDVDCDGTLGAGDVLLPGAVVGRPDIYLEYDYMVKTGSGAPCMTNGECAAGEQCTGNACTGHSHEPSAAALQLVIDSFAAHNIVLHVDPAPVALNEQLVVTPGPPDPACTGPDAVDFYAIKDAQFPSEQSAAYHYALFAHYSCAAGPGCGGSSCPNPAVPSNAGMAEQFGDDLIVSFGLSADLGIPISDLKVGGTLMHELGHNLGLRHSGDTDLPKNEPNYFSVMNPSYQFGIGESLLPGPYPTSPVDPADGHRIDFSGLQLDPLNENSLDEILGVFASPASTDVTLFFADGGAVQLFAPSNGTPIDWDNDLIAGNPMALADINGDGNLDILTGFDDWTSVQQSFLGLLLQFQCNAGIWAD